MMFRLISILWVPLALLAVPAHAESATAPSTPWTLDYDDDSCALRRMFGDGGDRYYVEFRKFQPGPEMQVVLASEGRSARNTPDLRFRFDAQGDWQKFPSANTLKMREDFSGVIFFARLIPFEFKKFGDLADYTTELTSPDTRRREVDAAAQIERLELRGAFGHEVALQLEPMDKPIEAMNGCIDELMTHWDIDVEAHKELSRPAIPVNLRQAGRMVDYPPKMMLASMPGIVNIRLAIDETGRITGCHIQMPLSDPVFEESSCADVQHALDFDPALDKTGKPIPSYWVTKVIFRLN